MLSHFGETTQVPQHDICVIGVGPGGIALALATEAEGFSVLLIESGNAAPGAIGAELSKAQIRDPAAHAPMEIASCRALGGMWNVEQRRHSATLSLGVVIKEIKS